jgi:hypothetical protein
MSFSDPVMRLLRLMTHVNMGAGLGMLAWLTWSGWQIVTGQMAPPPRAPVQPHPPALQTPGVDAKTWVESAPLLRRWPTQEVSAHQGKSAATTPRVAA